MAEIIELSSDEETNVSSKITYQELSNGDTDDHTDFSDIIKKHSKLKEKYNAVSVNSPKQDSSDATDEDMLDIHLLKEKLSMKYDIASDSRDTLKSKCSADDIFASTSEPNSTHDDTVLPKTKKLKSNDNTDKQNKKLEKERLKAEKQAEKERLKAENEKAKAEKQALANTYKNIKPDECIKFMTALIDSDLICHFCASDIPNALQAVNVTYKVVSNVHPFTVTWSRKCQTQLSTIGGQLSLANNEGNCNHVLLIMLWDQCVQLVHAKKLLSDIELKRTLFPDKLIHLGIFGLENYFSQYKSRKQKCKDKAFANVPKVSRKDIDMALIELQIMYGISHRMLETPQDVSSLVAQLTKSIAQIPYKLQKQQRQEQMEWYVAGDNKDSVKVDKNGNGLSRLWQQQLTQFTLARLETAEAIASMYPSPASLMRAYAQCANKRDGEKLLQDVPVRRAAGPLTSVRKIGPELSKKVFTLFTSSDGTAFI